MEFGCHKLDHHLYWILVCTQILHNRIKSSMTSHFIKYSVGLSGSQEIGGYVGWSIAHPTVGGPNLTTIPVEPKILGKSGLLKLKTCSLYHENLLLQKFNYMITQVLKYFFSASDIIQAVSMFGSSHSASFACQKVRQSFYGFF